MHKAKESAHAFGAHARHTLGVRLLALHHMTTTFSII